MVCWLLSRSMSVALNNRRWFGFFFFAWQPLAGANLAGEYLQASGAHPHRGGFGSCVLSGTVAPEKVGSAQRAGQVEEA